MRQASEQGGDNIRFPNRCVFQPGQGGSGAYHYPRQSTLGMGNDMPHRLWNRGFHHTGNALDYGIRLVYWGIPLPSFPISGSTAQLLQRNMRIREAYADGITVPDLAR